MIRAGIDTGGTFTDFAIRDSDGTWRRLKILSTPEDPSMAIFQGLEQLSMLPPTMDTEIVHGTTVGTNAFLERKGARTLLITTAGFEDVLFIGRQARPCLYDFMVEKPAPIIPRQNILGVQERIGPDGRVISPLTEEELQAAVEFCREMTPESIAICFLHSYANPEHEILMERRLSKELRVPVSRSSKVMPEFREYERFSTTVINAYLNPVVGRYVNRLANRLKGTGVFIQQSNGGCRPASSIHDKAVTTLLSGPAGGVQAALGLARSLGIDKIITFDMGGTSTDVSLCAGSLTYTRDYKIDGYPVGLPIIDIHTVGAGGGSIAWIDRGGLMKVGPQSAGADPGPICYGKGTEVTVTDANLFLGRLRADRFLAGNMKLHVERIGPAIKRLSQQIGLGSVETALGIIRLVNSNMVQAIRAVSVERGFDPSTFSLVCYGGAAGLHAAEVAQELNIDRVVIPERAGVFSARGMADADLVFEGSEALIIGDALKHNDEIQLRMDELIRHIKEEITAHTGDADLNDMTAEMYIDCRYHGQSFELTVPWGKEWHSCFESLHRQLYGYIFEARPVDITAIRARVILKRELKEAPAPLCHSLHTLSSDAFRDVPADCLEYIDVTHSSGPCSAALISRTELQDGIRIAGPAVVVDDFTTILIPEGWSAGTVKGHMIMQRK